eukprot:SAG11_NODE_32862_length_280_cov_0.856354_1_plen_28_part_01
MDEGRHLRINVHLAMWALQAHQASNLEV